MTIKVGSGGRGGKSGSYYDPDLGQNVSDGNADGNSGGQSSITSSDGTVYLKAKGGSYGSRGSSSGGSGGSYESSTSGTYCVKGCSGGRGGGVSNNKAATGCATLTAYCTANTSTTLGSGSNLATYKT